MQILIIKNDNDLKRVLQHTDAITVCKLINPYPNPYNHIQEKFANINWRYAIYDDKIEGIDSVDYQHYLCKRLEFKKRYVNAIR